MNMDNSIAFNVKLAPGPKYSRETIDGNMHSYIKIYFEMGGMQMQFNAVNSDVLKGCHGKP